MISITWSIFKAIKLLLLAALGLAYLLTGILSIINWGVDLVGVNQQFYSNFIPRDLGFALVALTVGASLVASTLYALRGNQVMHLAAAAIGTWLALGALVIQAIVAAATALDSVVLGENIDYSFVDEQLLRMDVILGCVALPISVYYTLMLREMIKSR